LHGSCFGADCSLGAFVVLSIFLGYKMICTGYHFYIGSGCTLHQVKLVLRFRSCPSLQDTFMPLVHTTGATLTKNGLLV
jgi:hypothetical protein